MQTASEFASNYLSKVLPLFDEYRSAAFESAVRLLETAYRKDATVFVCGNGGSAGTGSHMVNDLNKCTTCEGKRRLRALGLSDNMSLFSAYANDCGYETVFVEQLKSLWRPGDVLIAISASGNSKNVVLAAEYAKANRGSVIGLVGFSGGLLKGLSDTAIHFKSFNYGAVEDAQLMFSHLASQYLHEYISECGAAASDNVAARSSSVDLTSTI